MTPDEQFALSCHYAFHTKVVACPSGTFAIIDRNFKLLEIVSESELPSRLRFHFTEAQQAYHEAKTREDTPKRKAQLDINFDDLFS